MVLIKEKQQELAFQGVGSLVLLTGVCVGGRIVTLRWTLTCRRHGVKLS